MGSVTIYAPEYAENAAAPQQTEQHNPPIGPAPAPTLGKDALERKLPEGWTMRKSRSTGKVYYVNEKLGKSQFDPPIGSTVKVKVKKKQRAITHTKDLPDARLTDKNGMMGVIRASEQRKGRWA